MTQHIRISWLALVASALAVAPVAIAEEPTPQRRGTSPTLKDLVWATPANSDGTEASPEIRLAQADILLPENSPRRERTIPLRRNTEDPADQIAPPGLDVRPGDAPITPYLAIAMRSELDNLVGRFESALILANAANQPSALRATNNDALLTATKDDAELALRSDAARHPVLLEARQLIQDWPGLIQQRSYAEARGRWLAVRQSLWENFPTDRAFAQTEIRAMWLDRGTIVRMGSRDRMARLFDEMQAAGINTVFLETINAGYTIYPSRVAPSQNPLTRRWDPLQVAIELAHERDMELHAWMWVFAAGNQLHNAILNLPTDYLGPSLHGNPSWAGYDNAGNIIPRGQTKPFFDPANPEVRRYLLNLIDEIVTNYDVDGLQLDYIRYPFQDPGANRTYGYGVAARRQFQAMTGVDPLNLTPRITGWDSPEQRERQRALWQRWTEFRIQQVTSFVSETSTLVRRRRPGAILSTAVFALPEHERLQKIQQDWGSWAKSGLVDWIVLMSYAQDTNRFEELIQPWVVQNDYRPTLVIPGIRLLNLPPAAAIDQMQALRDLPTPGYALFAADNLTPGLQGILNKTQGEHQAAAPQSNAFKTAHQRYQSLQKEWRWLMESGQLWVDPTLLRSWAREVNALEADLAALANAPNARESAVLRSRLETLRQGLGPGMDIQTATTRDYRIRAWRNRILSIERFLAYGEARL